MKAGYAGEDTPKAVFPSTVGVLAKGQESAGKKDGGDVEMKDAGDGRHFLVNDMSYRRDHMELESPFNEEGLLEDWDVVEAIWDHTLRKRLVVEPNEHPILMGEPVHTTREARHATPSRHPVLRRGDCRASLLVIVYFRAAANARQQCQPAGRPPPGRDAKKGCV